jgi:hypothetical protein
MATSRETIPAPTVVLPVGDGRVEITVVDNEIWLSDYASGESRNFTLVIPRSKLQGNKSARDSVYDHHCKKGGNGKYASKRLAAVSKQLTAQPPAIAGYWYELPSPAHGGPVVIVEE